MMMMMMNCAKICDNEIRHDLMKLNDLIETINLISSPTNSLLIFAHNTLLPPTPLSKAIHGSCQNCQIIVNQYYVSSHSSFPEV